MASLIPGSETPVQGSAPIILVESIPSIHSSRPSNVLRVPSGIFNLYVVDSVVGNPTDQIIWFPLRFPGLGSAFLMRCPGTSARSLKLADLNL